MGIQKAIYFCEKAIYFCEKALTINNFIDKLIVKVAKKQQLISKRQTELLYLKTN